MSDEWPTVKKLVDALREAKVPGQIIINAKNGDYHDYLTSYATPLQKLVEELRFTALGRRKEIVQRHEALVQRVIDGEFDATKEEAELWAASEEGQLIFKELLGDDDGS